MSVRGGKGKFAYGKPAGLFFPHEDGKVRLTKPGETWHLVEGAMDSAAMHGLGLLACGLNTCRLAAKFARLLKDVDVVLVPDRDRAGEEGSQHSARVLRGMASPVRVAVLPAEFKESNGDDVRDLLRRPAGRELVLQAIADAKLSEASDGSGDGEDSDVLADIQTPELRAVISEHRAAIVERLRHGANGAAGRPPRCVACDRQYWVNDPPQNGRIRTTCGKCGRFIGYRPKGL